MGNKKINIKPIYKEAEDIVHPRMITIISHRSCARIMLEDIELVEQDGRILHIITANRDYAVYESIETLAAMLNIKSFYRPLKKLIINFDHVKDIEGNYINFESGQSAALGRNNICKVRNAFRRYLMDYPPYTAEGVGLRVAEDD